MEPNRLGDITAFVSAVKTGSFTAAASALGLTRSAVGKSVARLEARLATRLLQRTTRTLSLTDDGRAVYERWRQILEDLEEVEATMAVRRGQPAGTLKLTAPLSFGQRHILPLLDHYMKQWPELRADVRFTDRFVDVVEEGFDIALRIGAPKDDTQLFDAHGGLAAVRDLRIAELSGCQGDSASTAGTSRPRHDRVRER